MYTFDELKKNLESRRAELIEKLNRVKVDLAKPYNSDWEEQAQERENDEVLDQLGSNFEEELTNINAALDRIKNNQYGICENCSTKIPLARIELRPESIRCVQCAA